VSNRKASLIAGVLAGITGLMVFLVIHHLWIKPIWFILPLGLVIAVAGGSAVGWAYGELLPGLPRRPWTTFTWFALIGLTLAPAVVIAQLRPPLFTGSGMNVIANVSIAQAGIIFIRDLLLPATVIGGLVGWLIGRTKRAALATALAGFFSPWDQGIMSHFWEISLQPGKASSCLLPLYCLLPSYWLRRPIFCQDQISMIEQENSVHSKNQYQVHRPGSSKQRKLEYSIDS
jgi:hypothetical protein